jgi:hypothetical protein
MTVRKTANFIETEELLKLLEEPQLNQETPDILYKNDILSFISVFNIQSGEDRIKKNTLYSIYRVWSKNPIPSKDFHLEMFKFLPVCQVQNAAGYNINQNAIKLTHEAYSLFKQQKVRTLKSKRWTQHFENFLLFHALTSGNFWLESDILYFIYDKYTHERGLDRTVHLYMTKEVFYIYADIFLKHKITKYGKMYGISENIQNFFQPDQLARMQKAHAKEIIEKDKPKSKRKTSKPKRKV